MIASFTGSPVAVSWCQAAVIFARMDGPPALLGAVRYPTLTGVWLSTAYLTCL
jgi:hypothetical protein